MRILAIGDVCGAAGCRALLKLLPIIKKQEGIDLTIVNGENSAVGNGITPESAELIFAAGADVITGGNHTLRRRELHPLLDENPFLLRPHNICADYGSGYTLVDLGRCSVAVINLSGQIYINDTNIKNPFEAADMLVSRAKDDGAGIIAVDFHAEATSEKRALGLYLDGRVSVFFGTHTHVQTADAQVLPNSTGYITDIGMTGAIDSVLGVKSSIIIDRLKNSTADKFIQEDSRARVEGCVFDIDQNGKTLDTKLIYMEEKP